MTDYVKIHKSDDMIHIWFYNEDTKILSIGEKMYEINENAYMNGYNWDALFQYYLNEHAPDLLEELEPDPEAGSYAAYYPLTKENEKKAEQFVQIIISLIENEEELYKIVREHNDEIEWD